MEKIKKILILTCLFTAIILSGCNADKGYVSLSLTDAPIDSSNVSGVFVTISSIEFHHSGDGWITAEDFTETKFNLLELTDGTTSVLSTMELPGGKITQIRFGIDDSVDGSTYGCYIAYNDNSADTPLSMPGGTDLKFTGEFDVPLNGDTLSIIADFDARKSVVERGNGSFSIKPAIRLIVENEAGAVSGMLSGNTGSVIVYAYETGSWNAAEADDPADNQVRFPNAVSSALVGNDGSFKISFLAPMDYTLVAVDADLNTILDSTVTVSVTAGSTATASIVIP